MSYRKEVKQRRQLPKKYGGNRQQRQQLTSRAAREVLAEQPAKAPVQTNPELLARTVSPDFALGLISQSVVLNLKDPPALDPSAAAAMQQNPQLRAQQLCELAKRSKLPLTLEVKDAAQQQDQVLRCFQIVQEGFAKALFQAEQDPLVTSRLPSHREILAHAQQEWIRQHGNTLTQEAELISKGYVAKAQVELINRENVKTQQISNAMGALRNQLKAYGYTVIAQ